jgi:hypothetical protein
MCPFSSMWAWWQFVINQDLNEKEKVLASGFRKLMGISGLLD